MKLRCFTDAGVEMARQYLAAVKESNDVDNVTLDGQLFTRATLLSSPGYTDAAAKSYFLVAVCRALQGSDADVEPGTWRTGA